MAEDKKDTSGVTISSGRDTNVEKGAIVAGGDVDAQIQVSEGLQASDVVTIKSLFEDVYDSIETKDLPVDKGIVKTTVEQIEAQVTDLEKPPDENRIRSLLKTLNAMAPDIFEVAVATFANPTAGVAMVINKIGKKIKEESSPTS